jgi:DNA-binding transcriptional regulator YdaS (Cro superfamily)
MTTLKLDALKRAVEKAGGQTALGRLCGESQARVWYWLNRSGELPAEHVVTVSEATGIPEHELRPDVFRKPLGPRDPVATSVAE